MLWVDGGLRLLVLWVHGWVSWCWHVFYVLWVSGCRLLCKTPGTPAPTHAHARTQTHTCKLHTFSHTRIHPHASYTNHLHTRAHARIDLARISYTSTLIGVYYARSSTPGMHVWSQYTTLPPLMIPVLSRQGPLRQ